MVVFFGPAGSGKSTLTSIFGDWLRREGYNVRTINIDVGAEFLPYEPWFDVRNHFTLVSLMKQEKLGPNGAFLRSMELLPKLLKKWSSKIVESETDFFLVDTPGQLEAFLLHPGGIRTINIFSKTVENRIVGFFLLNADFLKRRKDVAMLSFLTLAFQLRFYLPILPVVSKADVLPESLREKPLDFDETLKVISKEGSSQSALMAQILKIVKNFGFIERIIELSALKNTNESLSELFTLTYEAFCNCGDL